MTGTTPTFSPYKLYILVGKVCLLNNVKTVEDIFTKLRINTERCQEPLLLLHFNNVLTFL